MGPWRTHLPPGSCVTDLPMDEVAIVEVAEVAVVVIVVMVMVVVEVAVVVVPVVPVVMAIWPALTANAYRGRGAPW